ncbi:MAG: hypothetical protein OEY64_05630 [Nitrospinota bacterium]|nr:hypothetical protein [Nitrospinota bacterium]
MKKRLLIIRNPESSLLGSIKVDREGQKTVLAQNAVFPSNFDRKGCFFLENDAYAGNIKSEKFINYDGLLDAIIEADQVVTI